MMDTYLCVGRQLSNVFEVVSNNDAIIILATRMAQCSGEFYCCEKKNKMVEVRMLNSR